MKKQGDFVHPRSTSRLQYLIAVYYFNYIINDKELEKNVKTISEESVRNVLDNIKSSYALKKLQNIDNLKFLPMRLKNKIKSAESMKKYQRFLKEAQLAVRDIIALEK